MQSDKINQGVEIVKQAIKADQEKKYDEAYDLYMRSFDYFVVGLRYEKNQHRKSAVEQQVVSYMDRAEQLKKHLEDQKSGKNKPKAAAGGGGGNDADDESAHMKKQLEGAIVSTNLNVHWDDVAGLEAAKEALNEAVILPAKFPQLFTGKRRPWKGILLYGPPGTGKSYLATALATEASSKFISVSSSNLMSKWQGESEKFVKNLFDLAYENRPAIIFIDEIDSMCSSRSEGENDSVRRMKTEFLVRMQGVGNKMDGVLVLGATNTPWEIDSAMRRRFEKRIYIPLPDQNARAVMFKVHLGDTPNDISPAGFQELAKHTDGFSGSDINVVVRGALMEPVRLCRLAKWWRRTDRGTYEPERFHPPCPECPLDLSHSPVAIGTQCRSCGAERFDLTSLDPKLVEAPKVNMTDFMKVMKTATSSVSKKELVRYQEWTEEFGEEGS